MKLPLEVLVRESFEEIAVDFVELNNFDLAKTSEFAEKNSTKRMCALHQQALKNVPELPTKTK